MMKHFALTVRNVKNVNEFQALTERIEAYDLARYVFDTGSFYPKTKEATFSTWEEQEWSSYNGCMLRLSEELPRMTFELTVWTLDTFWKVYYKDGITEVCTGTVIYEAPKRIAWDSLVAF